LLSFHSVSIAFPGRDREPIEVLSDVSLELRPQEFLVLLGPSGCGKSTLLNVAAGLLKPYAGSVSYGGAPLVGVNTQVGYMTQRDTLLPWRTVEQNVGLALEIKRVQKDQRRLQIAEALNRVNLTGFERAYPSELSGGMRKRAILARTLIYEPETLLMDEPFADLDAQLRALLQQQLLDLWEAKKKTVIFVTHDLGEAITLADRVVVFTARPARIKLIMDVPFGRPRDIGNVRTDPRFGELYDQLWQALRTEVRIGA
jgi:NitT/TauT family transport system ATP-binding protein